MAEGALPRWSEALLRASLRAFPRSDRATLGPSLLSAARESVIQAAGRSGKERSAGSRTARRVRLVRETLAEASAIVAGGLVRRRELLRDALHGAVGGTWTDLRLGMRSLRRAPGFVALVAGTLAVGVGANAAVFSLVDAVLLRPPPYPHPEELIAVWATLPGTDERVPVAGPDAALIAERAERVERIAFSIRGVDGAIETADGAGARHVTIASVTPDFFDVLGIAPALGRTFVDDDAASGDPDGGEPPVVVVADRLWRDALAADPAALGAEIVLNGRRVVIVGVMPADFALPLPPDAGVATDVDVWTPLTVPLAGFHREPGRLLDRDSDNSGVVVGRLASGATPAQASDELDLISAELRAEVPDYGAAGLGFEARPLLADASAHARPVLLALLAGAAALFVVLTMNVATLLLARGMAREPEMAVRLALGGARVRLVRQMLAEHVLLLALGVGGGLALAAGSTPALSSLVPASLSPPAGIETSGRTIAFGGALAMVAVLVLGLAPALTASAREARGVLAAGIGARRTGRSVGRRRLVAAQVAVSVALVLASGLLLRSVRALDQIDPGFEPEGALTFRVSLRVPDRYRSPAFRAELMREITRRIEALPGARAVGLAGVLPLGGDRWSQPYGLPGQPEDVWHENRADFQTISSGYFEAIGARLLEGRSFTAHEDLEEDERVAVVDQKLAARIARGGSVLGSTIGIPLDGAAVQARVVGVVEHVRHDRLDRDGREAIYVPYRQEASRDVAFVVRTSGDPASLAPAIRRVVREVDPQIPVYALEPLQAYLASATAPRRFALTLLAGFGLLTLVSAALGMFGVMAYDVSRRTREIGVRLAVGASRREVVRSVVLDGLRLGGVGLAVGALLALAVARAMQGLLVGVGAADPATWTIVLACVAAVIVAASWVPARRASRLSPTVALRID